MSNLPAGAEFDSDAPWNDVLEHECPMCDAPVEKEGKYCSNDCWDASML